MLTQTKMRLLEILLENQKIEVSCAGVTCDSKSLLLIDMRSCFMVRFLSIF